ncbi:MAG: hypothetical protein O2912_00360 [Proteobacteria bacterium]|nr:hypothetical protein [Pseudomonadota bacterium]
MATKPEDILDYSRDALNLARKYAEEAKQQKKGSKERKFLEERAKDKASESQKWSKIAKTMASK